MASLIARVLEHAARTPDRVAVRVLSPRKGDAARTFGELMRDAGRAAAFFAARGVGRGDVVVLVGTHHADLYATWLGAVWVGAVPSILAEPSVRVDPQIYWSRLRALLDRIEAKLLVTDPAIELEATAPASQATPRSFAQRAEAQALQDVPRAIARHTYFEAATGHGGSPPPLAAARPEDPLLLQHSSGTTGLQKGVLLTHGEVTLHCEAYQSAITLESASDVVASWLPLYHDMGMIACFVMPLYYGVPVVQLSPFEWVANPSLLLDAIARYRATITYLPNFAFLHLAQRARSTYDLSSLRMAINCSEPITQAAMDALPVPAHASYAMAENVFAVTQSTREDPPRTIFADPARWRAEHVASEAPEGLPFVSSGTALRGCEVRIADGLPAFHAGPILIRSPWLFLGYHGDPRRDALDAEGFFDTGDLGFLDDRGHLYVTGRAKDLVIVGGKNVYPQDIEHVVNDIEGVHPGRVVCFGIPARDLDTEALVVLVESELPEAAWPELARRIRRAVPAALDLDLADARVVPRGALRKSTSGKLARAGNRDWYLASKESDR